MGPSFANGVQWVSKDSGFVSHGKGPPFIGPLLVGTYPFRIHSQTEFDRNKEAGICYMSRFNVFYDGAYAKLLYAGRYFNQNWPQGAFWMSARSESFYNFVIRSNLAGVFEASEVGIRIR